MDEKPEDVDVLDVALERVENSIERGTKEIVVLLNHLNENLMSLGESIDAALGDVEHLTDAQHVALHRRELLRVATSLLGGASWPRRSGEPSAETIRETVDAAAMLIEEVDERRPSFEAKVTRWYESQAKKGPNGK